MHSTKFKEPRTEADLTLAMMAFAGGSIQWVPYVYTKRKRSIHCILKSPPRVVTAHNGPYVSAVLVTRRKVSETKLCEGWKLRVGSVR
jgi:hypothetical protein